MLTTLLNKGVKVTISGDPSGRIDLNLTYTDFELAWSFKNLEDLAKQSQDQVLRMVDAAWAVYGE